jgi:hypothetical protein
MKLYENKETAPLAFYKAFMYVLLPLGAVICVYSLLSYILLKNLYSVYAAWYIQIMIVQCIVLLLLYGFIFFGMLKWKKYTFALIIVLVALCCLTSALSTVYVLNFPMVYTGFSDYQMSSQFTSLLQTMITGAAIFSAVVNVGLYILMFFYFYKRRHLFDGVPYKIPPKNAQYYPPRQPYPPPYDLYAAQCCPNCGAYRPSAEYLFCPECGGKYLGQ